MNDFTKEEFEEILENIKRSEITVEAQWEIVDEFSYKTGRSAGGFGSSSLDIV